jgi:hypothetical protein
MEEEPVTDQTPIGELFPAMLDLPEAPTHEVIGGPLLAHLERRGELTWAGLAALSSGQIAQLPNLGPTRTKRILSNLSGLVGPPTVRQERPSSNSMSDSAQLLLAAFEEIAAWSVGNAGTGSVLDALQDALRSEAADVPIAELQLLAELPASALAPPQLVRGYDPVIAATELIAAFEERERAILDRVLDFDGSAPTLQEIGDRYQVTRERIRQIEVRVRRRLDSALSSPETRALVAAADRLRERLGAVVPAELLVGEFNQYPPDLVDRLILHLAGPYRFDGDWYVLSAIGNLATCVRSTFDSVAEGGVAPVAALVDALTELGVRPEYAERAILSDERFRVRDDLVLDWDGSLSSKATIALRVAGRPLSFDEVLAFVQPNSHRSLSNAVHADERITRVGVARFALAEWDMDEFHGIVPAMVERLADGPVELELLRDELAREYAISPNSVGIMASTHPVFLVESGKVMLRPADRPYVPSDDLEATRSCYLVDGVWSWRVPVDRDVLRGSGRQLPEAFAVHLGAAPLSKGHLDSPVGPIGLAWNQHPTIGSLRAAANSLEAEEGDWLFVRRDKPSSIDFKLLRAQGVPTDPVGAIKALVGAADSTASLEQVLADALGLRGSVNHDLGEERAVLTARREQDLVDLLDADGH